MNLLEHAIHWAKELGFGENEITKLSGGINNHVFSCGYPHKSYTIKAYPERSYDYQDRMGAEVSFLQYEKVVVPGKVPELIAVDIERRCIIMEYIYGRIYSELSSPCKEEISEALSFIRHLNTETNLAKEMVSNRAADGFHSLTEHMLSVRNRIEMFGTEHLPSRCKQEAQSQIEKLEAECDATLLIIEKAITRGIVKDRINEKDQIVSPSDFGFHNAIKTKSGIKFIDFEFSGWDDPAKTAVDFALQPRIAVNQPISLICKELGIEDKNVQLRCPWLAKILYVKWKCIILSLLNPVRFDRDHEIQNSVNISDIVLRRIERAQRYNPDAIRTLCVDTESFEA